MMNAVTELSMEEMNRMNGGCFYPGEDEDIDEEKDPEWIKNARKTVDRKIDEAGKAIQFTFKSVWRYLFG